MRRLVHLLLLLALVACASSGEWAWRRLEGPPDPEQLRVDIDDCETQTRMAEDRGPFPATASARPYGGWGNFTFESCMHRRGWALKPVTPGEPRATAAPAAETPAGAVGEPAGR